MKSAVIIKDLPLIKWLDSLEMSVVRGGTKFVIQPFLSHGEVDDYCGTVPHKVPPMPGPTFGNPIKLQLPGRAYAN